MKGFVSEKISKSLMQNGFKEKCYGQWRYDHQFSFGFDTSLHQIPAPTYQQVIDWFREIHEIFIEVKHYDDMNGGIEYGIEVSQTKTWAEKSEYVKSDFKDYYNALDKGIIESLKLLS